MSRNRAREQGLIVTVEKGLWAHQLPAEAGYEFVLLEKTEDGGTRFFRILKPGETLSLSEKFLPKLICLKVDKRQRTLSIAEEFALSDKQRTVKILAHIRYAVADAQIVATAESDPLDALYAIVYAELETIFRNLAEVREDTFDVIKARVLNVDGAFRSGFGIHDIEITGFVTPALVGERIVTVDRLLHQIDIPLLLNALESRFDDFLRQRLLGQWPGGKLSIFPDDLAAVQDAITTQIREAMQSGALVFPDGVTGMIVASVEKFAAYRLDTAVSTSPSLFARKTIPSVPIKGTSST